MSRARSATSGASKGGPIHPRDTGRTATWANTRTALTVEQVTGVVPTRNTVHVDAIEVSGVLRYARCVVSVLVSLLHSLRFVLRSRMALHLEILALRHQLTVVHR